LSRRRMRGGSRNSFQEGKKGEYSLQRSTCSAGSAKTLNDQMPGEKNGETKKGLTCRKEGNFRVVGRLFLSTVILWAGKTEKFRKRERESSTAKGKPSHVQRIRLVRVLGKGGLRKKILGPGIPRNRILSQASISALRKRTGPD